MRWLILMFLVCTAFFASTALLALALGDQITLQKRCRMFFNERSAHPKPRKKDLSLLNRLIPKKELRFLNRLADELYLGGIALRPMEFLGIWMGCGIGIPVLASFLDVRLAMVLGLVIIGNSLPVVFVRMQKEKSLKQFDSQILDALTILCNSLRAGFSFQTALENIAAEMQDPIAREFRRAVRECKLGMPLEESLNGLVKRSGNEDLSLIMSAVLIQKQVGGNLAEVLDNIAETIRQRVKLRGDIKVMTASGTMSGYIVGLLPVFLLVALMFLNPSYVEGFFSNPSGQKLLAVAACMELVGFIFVRKIVNVKF